MNRTTPIETMTSRERVRRALTFGTPDRLPRQLWVLYSLPMFRQNDMDYIQTHFPQDFGCPSVRYGQARRQVGEPGRKGIYTDAWGCQWVAAEDGVTGEVKHPPLADLAAIRSYQPPWEVIREADFSDVNRSVAESNLFIQAGTPNLYERLQYLRGTQNLLMDLMYGTPEVMTLIEMLHEYFMEELKLWLATDVDGIVIMDDWGSQKSLLINPEMWRELFKPYYADYCSAIRKAGKFVFFHSDGYIEPIYEDLIELGVQGLNSQLFCMDIEELGRKYKGRITFWGEIDRQNIMPYGTAEENREAVRRVCRALYDPKGGMIAQCSWGTNDPTENVEAIFDEWDRISVEGISD